MISKFKTIVTTTIQPPTDATIEFSKKEDWHMIIVGDLKTPHDEYRQLEKRTNGRVKYLSPEEQDKNFKDLSESIGWNCIQRRSIGLLQAYSDGYEVIATVDDDNIPYRNWGENVHVGEIIDVDTYISENSIFDPLSVTNAKNLWHRGYPYQLVNSKNNVKYLGKTERQVLIQADLWDGDPDVDAIERMLWNPLVKLNITEPFCSTQISPFNSQNTFLHRSIIPWYFILPHVGRMDDIWPSYIVQRMFRDVLIYGPATVYQKRNEQDLTKNLENEVFGYRNTPILFEELDKSEVELRDPDLKGVLPIQSYKSWELWRQEIYKIDSK